MQIKLYKRLPQEARDIRQRVFINEQGFLEEFDEMDSMALHLLAFEGESPMGTCRFFWEEEKSMFILGRLAVLPEYRGMGTGAALVREAERQVDKLGGRELYLHAQCEKKAFYKKLGYRPMGAVELDQGCPHIWMFRQW